jgi:hypothetical protein
MNNGSNGTGRGQCFVADDNAVPSLLTLPTRSLEDADSPSSHMLLVDLRRPGAQRRPSRRQRRQAGHARRLCNARGARLGWIGLIVRHAL